MAILIRVKNLEAEIERLEMAIRELQERLQALEGRRRRA